MSVADYPAVFLLPEDLRKPHGRYSPAPYYVGKYPPWSNGWQLVGIAHQYEPAVLRQRGKQRPHKDYIHHGALVHNYGPAFQRIVLVFCEEYVFPVLRHFCSKHTVYGGGLPAC